MFKKGPDIDKKKLLVKASDVKKDSLTRLKHFKILIEHLDYNEVTSLFNSHLSFIYHTFIDTFSNYDCTSKQRREDLDCILYMLEKILIYNSRLVKKRWQFFSITFVMQKLLHKDNSHKLRQEGVRLFILWYEILGDETNLELQNMFSSIVPGLVDFSQLSTFSRSLQATSDLVQDRYEYNYPDSPQLPIKLCNVDPLVAMSANEQLPTDETSFYLECLLHFMVTQTTKPCWSHEEIPVNYEYSFSFLFNMFKKIYMQSIFPNISQSISQKSRKSHLSSAETPPPPPFSPNSDQENLQNLSTYQAIVIRWLTRILRQDLISGQDEFIRPGGTGTKDSQAGSWDTPGNQKAEFFNLSEGHSTANFNNIETSSSEMEIARKVLGTWPENIAMVHEIFRRAFLDFLQPASMKRVVNVYKEWICSGKPNSPSNVLQFKLGYTSFGDLLQVFVRNSSSAFLIKVHNPTLLDEQVEMCKRIMNIYRYMVMKIYMNTATWEHLLEVILYITEQLFPAIPPEQKETTIGGRIAPAFFQTFIVSWIRANLYVHISAKMWAHFHRVMKNLILWRELIEEWGTTMSSLTRVLVKHVYGLNLSDLPLDKPQDRRRKPRGVQNFHAGALPSPSTEQPPSRFNERDLASQGSQPTSTSKVRDVSNLQRSNQNPSFRLERSNSEGFILSKSMRLYHSHQKFNYHGLNMRVRKIKSEYLLPGAMSAIASGRRCSSPSHTDVIDGTNLRDPTMIIGQAIESQIQPKPSIDSSNQMGKKLDKKGSSDKCVLLGGTVRGWTSENSVVMWRRMSGLFANINKIENPENHFIAMRCLAVMICEFIKTRENLGISVDNMSTPEQPRLIPPYTYYVAWLLEATHLPNIFQESRLTAYKLLCLISIRRHDIELPPQYYSAFYESLYRGLNSPDPLIHASIIKNATRILALELPGATFLANSLFERCRQILLNSPKELPSSACPRIQAIQLLNTILALYRPIKKLMVLAQDSNSSNMTLVAQGDIKTKILETFMACNSRPNVLDDQSRSQSLFAMTLHVYQEVLEKHDCNEVEELVNSLFPELSDPSCNDMFRIHCDMIRLLADHAPALVKNRPDCVSKIIQNLCQAVSKTGLECKREALNCILICLEDWSMSVGKSFLLQTVVPLNSGDDYISDYDAESHISMIMSSLDSVIHQSRGIKTSNTVDSQNPEILSDHGRTLTGESKTRPSDSSKVALQDNRVKAVRLACSATRQKLLTYLGHYPLRQLGPASLSCCISESDFSDTTQDSGDSDCNENMIVLVIDSSTMISFVGASAKDTNCANLAHLIVRNPCGKFSWDSTRIELPDFRLDKTQPNSITVDPSSFQQDDMRSSMRYDSDLNEDGNSSSSMSSRSSTCRDQISDLLHHLSSSSANGSSLTSNQSLYKKRNSAFSMSNSRFKVAQAEETMIALLVNQRFQELNYCERSGALDRVELKLGYKLSERRENPLHESTGIFFDHCRQLIQNLGYLSWENRSKVESLKKSVRLIRELKNLDAQSNRDTHKIAVIYVANGQEDKQSILSNCSGSRSFEEFVAALGWEVNLATHLGFKGGLQSNKSTGETSTYFCNSTTEVMFHVSTKIPMNGSSDDEALNRKLRHIGNDEIHIVWSEHSRDYRRGIIPTEFGDVIIAIYPMLTFQGYHRIQVLSKPEVPPFGPLFDNCVVHQSSLASLVKATAINASRAKRLDMPHYLSSYEERGRLIDSIVQNHKAKLSFEDFAVQLYQLDFSRMTQKLVKQETSCCS